MTKICYVPRRFNRLARETLSRVNAVLADYQADGYTLTVRQLYYQFVQRGFIPNNVKSYKNFANLVNCGRLAGEVDWELIEDRGRNLRGNSSWSSIAEIQRSTASSYHVNRWRNQPHLPEVWVEKEALSGVVERACGPLDVDYYSSKGYNSQSEAWRAGLRFAEARRRGQEPVVFYLGDHDPSGIDMTRDHRERLALFARFEVRLVRLALNWDQVQEHDPPPNPARESDSRCAGYKAEFGEYSWELDALEPRLIVQLIRDAVEPLVDPEKLADVEEYEAGGRAVLKSIARHLEGH